MSRKFLSIIAGASLFAVASVANAGEPTKLTAGQMDGVTAAGIGVVDVVAFLNKFKNVHTQIRLDKQARVGINVHVRGYLADAEAFAAAAGASFAAIAGPRSIPDAVASVLQA